MFLIGDTLEQRAKIIYELNLVDPTAAYILAFANFKWTVNRLMISLSKTPTSVLKNKLECVKDAQTLKSIWKKEVSEYHKAPSLSSIINNWGDIKFAYIYNDKLLTNASIESSADIHLVVPNIMEAAYDLCEYAKKHKLSLYNKVPIKHYRFMKAI